MFAIKQRTSSRVLIAMGLLVMLTITGVWVMQHTDKSDRLLGVTKSPTPANDSVFIPSGTPGVEAISIEQARARAKFKLLEPDPDTMPANSSLKSVVIQPQAAGEGYCLYYGDNIEIAVDPTNIPINIEEVLAETYTPDFSRPENQLKVYSQFEVNGIPAFGHDPMVQVLRDGRKNYVPAVLMWQVPGNGDIKYIRYTIFAEDLQVSKLLDIAKSLK